MAKSKKKKKTQSLVLRKASHTELEIIDRNVVRNQHPAPFTEADQLKWTVEVFGKNAKLKFKERIVLSAAKTLISGKAWLNAIACRNVFPGNPSIEFQNDRSDHFGGKLEFWLENLSGPKNLQFVIRMAGYTEGGATITVRSSMSTVYSLVPVDITGGMNLTLGNILEVPSSTPGGLGLVTLEVQFHNGYYGSWQFIDVSFTEAS